VVDLVGNFDKHGFKGFKDVPGYELRGQEEWSVGAPSVDFKDLHSERRIEWDSGGHQGITLPLEGCHTSMAAT
jgi:hypothetical protein